MAGGWGAPDGAVAGGWWLVAGGWGCGRDRGRDRGVELTGPNWPIIACGSGGRELLQAVSIHARQKHGWLSVSVSIAGLSESGVNAGLQEGDSLQQP